MSLFLKHPFSSSSSHFYSSLRQSLLIKCFTCSLYIMKNGHKMNKRYTRQPNTYTYIRVRVEPRIQTTSYEIFNHLYMPLHTYIPLLICNNNTPRYGKYDTDTNPSPWFCKSPFFQLPFARSRLLSLPLLPLLTYSPLASPFLSSLIHSAEPTYNTRYNAIHIHISNARARVSLQSNYIYTYILTDK